MGEKCSEFTCLIAKLPTRVTEEADFQPKPVGTPRNID